MLLLGHFRNVFASFTHRACYTAFHACEIEIKIGLRIKGCALGFVLIDRLKANWK